jgi:DNA-binding transcriptional regulator YiaG
MNMLTPSDIKKVRRDLGLTAQAFADRLNIHISTVFKWESGERHPTYGKMVEINKLAQQSKKQPA